MHDRPQDLSGVLESSMCIACGACVHADPSLDLRIDPEKQIYEPTGPGNELAATVCPAVEVDFFDLMGRLFPDQEQTPFGVVHSVMLAQSVDEDRNLKASSGGMIKELVISLLERDDVDGAIALKHTSGLGYEPTLITDPREVDELPGSIYHNLPKHKVLDLLKENDGRYVLISIPCELEGLYKYIFELAPHLEDRIHTTIGLICGWQYNYHALRAICEFKGIDYDRITNVSYRGGGPVGKLRIETENEQAAISRRVDFSYQVAFDRTFNTPRCHLCINHANFLADVVVGDAWLPSTVTTKTGISLVINRRSEMDEHMRSLHREGRIALTEVSTAEIEESQTRRIAFGDFAYSYADYLEKKGIPHPRMTAPNRDVAEPVPWEDVERFHQELTTKMALQRQGRYRYLRWRKATKELRRFLWKYLRWFLVRVLRIKSLTGERQELSRDELDRFR